MTEASAKSGFVAQIAEEQKRGEGRRKLLAEAVTSCQALTSNDLPPVPYINIIGSDTHAHFKTAMITSFREFVDRFSLNPDSVVLDIGCGCGRLAIPFSKFLTTGRFHGVDVWKDGIDWCNDNIASAHPGFAFTHLEARNNYYFEDFDPTVENDFQLEAVDDASLDFAYAISVFTHLSANDSLAYLKELSRTLKPDGAASLTTFIIDDFFFAYRARTGRHRAVKEFSEGCYHAYQGQDFFAGFTRRLWTQMCAQAGLRIISYELGKWAEKPGASGYQDVFVVMKEKP